MRQLRQRAWGWARPALAAGWRELRGDVQRVGLWVAVALAALGAFHLVPWRSTGGDVLSGLAFILVCMVVLVHVLRRIAVPIQLLAHAAEAKKHPIGAAIVFAAGLGFMAVLLWAFVTLFVRPVGAAELPAGLPAAAYRNLPVVLGEQAQFWPDHPLRSALAAQVEQETCVTLKSTRCWSERAELRTARERGVGLGQITRTARFDNLADLKARHGALLSGLTWERPYNAQLQARALVLQDRRLFYAVATAATERDRLAMMLVQYNAGPGTLAKRRARCSVTPGCDPARWFGHVERAVGRPQAVVAGYGKSFQDIATEYPRNVLVVRRPRYQFLDRA